jgi:hypothetical protein
MPALRTALSALALGVSSLLGAGCGNDRTPAPDVMTPGPPLGANTQSYGAAGLEFTAPAGWSVQPGEAPLVTTIATGQATISIFRYPRTEPLPRTPAALDAAATALAAAARQRDPTFAELKRARLRVDGRPAVVVRGTETIAGQPRTVRSTHVYAFGGEVVIDAIAPAEDFKRVDAEVFRPLVRSVRLRAPSP